MTVTFQPCLTTILTVCVCATDPFWAGENRVGNPRPCVQQPPSSRRRRCRFWTGEPEVWFPSWSSVFQRLGKGGAEVLQEGKRSHGQLSLAGKWCVRTHPVQKHVFIKFFPYNSAPRAERQVFSLFVVFFFFSNGHSLTSFMLCFLYTDPQSLGGLGPVQVSLSNRHYMLFLCLLVIPSLFILCFWYSSTDTMSQATLANHLPPAENPLQQRHSHHIVIIKTSVVVCLFLFVCFLIIVIIMCFVMYIRV